MDMYPYCLSCGLTLLKIRENMQTLRTQLKAAEEVIEAASEVINHDPETEGMFYKKLTCAWCEDAFNKKRYAYRANYGEVE